MSPRDAVTEALDRFGSVDRAKAGMRSARMAARQTLTVSMVTLVVLSFVGAIYWNSRSRIYDLGAGITAPVPVVTPHPEYTASAMRAKIQGTVRVRCVVRLDGVCADVTVVRSLDRTYGLDDEAVRAIRDWRFRPALRAGTPAATRIDSRCASRCAEARATPPRGPQRDAAVTGDRVAQRTVEIFAGMKRAGVRVLAGSDLIILAFTGADNGGRSADISRLLATPRHGN